MLLCKQAENLATVLFLTSMSKSLPQLVPNYLEIVLHLVLSSSSVLQIFKNNTQKQTGFSKWHSIQMHTMHHIKCSQKLLSIMFLEPPGFLILLVTSQNSSSCFPDLCFFCCFQFKPSIKLHICKYRLAG